MPRRRRRTTPPLPKYVANDFERSVLRAVVIAKAQASFRNRTLRGRIIINRLLTH